MDNPTVYEKASDTAHFLRGKLPAELQVPKVAVVCGSGLSGLADSVGGIAVSIKYEDIDSFPKNTVAGHPGKLVFGMIGSSKTPAVLLVGRAHFYEGHSIEAVTFAIRVCKLLGVEKMIVTNAAGGLNPEYQVGDVVVINDHLNIPGLTGISALRGSNEKEFGPRFPAMSDAYDLELRRHVHHAWKTSTSSSDLRERSLHEGVYAYVVGPSYETRAECRMLHMLGADLVGMSTVPEIVVARHSGIRILALSLVTNRCVLQPVIKGDDPIIQDMDATQLYELLNRGRANHEEVLQAGADAAVVMRDLVKTVIENLYP